MAVHGFPSYQCGASYHMELVPSRISVIIMAFFSISLSFVKRLSHLLEYSPPSPYVCLWISKMRSNSLSFFSARIVEGTENFQEGELKSYGVAMMERLTGGEGGRIDHMLQVRTLLVYDLKMMNFSCLKSIALFSCNTWFKIWKFIPLLAFGWETKFEIVVWQSMYFQGMEEASIGIPTWNILDVQQNSMTT